MCIRDRLINRLLDMGYLQIAGRSLTFKEILEIANYIRKHGAIQLCNLIVLRKEKKSAAPLKWGDEMEYHLVLFDHTKKKVKLLLHAKDFQDLYNEATEKGEMAPEFFVQAEYGAWMLEVIPKAPHEEISTKVLAELEGYFKRQAHSVNSYLNKFGTIGISRIPSFPIMGAGDYAARFSEKDYNKLFPKADPQFMEETKDEPCSNEESVLPLNTSGNIYSQSIFTFDAAINPHPRFPTLTRNIRERRRKKVSIKVPLFMDECTRIANVSETAPYPECIYMDSMQFGMGCCCLQLTFEALSLNHARYVHDQLLALAPVITALSASSPIFNGQLANIDVRFTVISQAVDDRTDAERDPTSPDYIHKSRYSNNSHYVSSHECIMPHHNDSPRLPIDKELHAMILKAGIDSKLAYHFASLFIRDPLVVFEKAIELNDDESTVHFENFQSTNWNTVRLKPPPSMTSEIGWRVEFRPLDLQLTDYENACLAAFVSLLVKLVTTCGANFIIPISMCDDNMERAHRRGAVLNEKFNFRTNVMGSKEGLEESDYVKYGGNGGAEKEVVREMKVEEILAGNKEIGYPGLLPLIEELLKEDAGSEEERAKVKGYMDFLLKRAQGKYKTGAKYIRDFVSKHPEYKQNSLINEQINYDLMCELESLTHADPIKAYAESIH
eukprot:TRINITY_DN10285_c0_g1_i4.p1 TRINITY_DN10285_c0_g1~~TRINITY_DN10285_c0_g1_i4.p1  ORF type:complete len:667 (+),score=151.12 TRINITY_DN10285_c0_g1_i4:66-2066(+)